MSKYIHFTNEEKERARNTDITDMLMKNGESLKKSGKEYEWKDGSQKVTINGNLWFHQYERIGGDAIDFVRRFYDKDYPEAVQFLLNGNGSTLIISPPIIQKEAKPFILPERNNNMRRAFAYLYNSRGINKDVIYSFVKKGLIYESAKYHNVVFVGLNNEGVPCHANMRGTIISSSFKGNAANSLPEYSFHWTGTDNTVYLFEAPIDMLSYISMHKDNWQSHSYVASCGVSDKPLLRFLKDNPKVNKVFLCMDNDEAGQSANNRISNVLTVQNIENEILVPKNKDWNEDLLHLVAESEESICQALQ